MSKRKNRVGLFLALIAVLFLGLGSGGQKIDRPAADGTLGPLVEVHGPEVAYVPLTAKYVTYDGVVRKIARISAATPGVKCNCPNCCDGMCYVVIYSDLLGGKVGALSIYYLWTEC